MLNTAMIFSDHMVLQREKKVPVWGEADPGSRIRVRIGTAEAESEADDRGRWKVLLPEMEAASGLELEILSQKERIVFKDVCIGEVWLAGGQSNMEFLLGFEKHFEEVLQQAMRPQIRFLEIPEAAYEGALEDYDYRNDGFWRCCTPEDLPWFSACGYYFACRIADTLKVPVGIIGCNWGGTPACAWMDPEDLKGTAGEIWLREYEEAVKDLDPETYRKKYLANPGNDRTDQLHDAFGVHYVKGTIARELQPRLMEEIGWTGPAPLGPYHERRPGGLYENMLKKAAPAAIRGVIYYQGESDGDDAVKAEAYREVFPAMIRCWRRLWGEELPFLFVQLAPFDKWMECDGKDYHIVRRGQAETAESMQGVYMISSSDAGMEWDIHPKDKKVIGDRLALMAEGEVYGLPVSGRAPLLESYQVEGDQIRLTFAHAQGLHTEGGPLRELYGVTEEGEKKALESVYIRENRIEISGCGDMKKIRFAMDPYYEVNLYNEAHLPAHPFEIEWDETQR